MPNYKRSKSGHLFFFTVVTLNRQKIFNTEANRETLRAAIKKVQNDYPFINEAFVLLPDHLHCIWRLPDTDYSKRWGMIKREFSRTANIPPATKRSDSAKKKRESGIWQRRFWEHTIKDEKDYENHVNYIHYNPVKHGLVKYPSEWEYSSFHRFVKLGRLSADWCATEKAFINFQAGE